MIINLYNISNKYLITMAFLWFSRRLYRKRKFSKMNFRNNSYQRCGELNSFRAWLFIPLISLHEVIGWMKSNQDVFLKNNVYIRYDCTSPYNNIERIKVSARDMNGKKLSVKQIKQIQDSFSVLLSRLDYTVNFYL